MLLYELHDIEYVEENSKIKPNCRKYSNTDINLNQGMTAQYVSNIIMTESDRQVARERSHKLKEEEKTTKEQLDDIKTTITTGQMMLNVRQYGLFPSICDHVQNCHEEK